MPWGCASDPVDQGDEAESPDLLKLERKKA